jgi:hypothetical protein
MNMYGNRRFEFFPLQVRTAYAEALERLEELEVTNLTANLASCSLLVRNIRGRKYVYAQGRLADGSARHAYLGPLNERSEAIVERFNKEKAKAGLEHKNIDTLAKMLRSVDVPSLDPIEWRVVSALAADGVFRVGGVLVGTIAYRCIAGYLGVRFPSASAVTADVDIASTNVPVAIIPEVVCPQTALERLEMGFSPMLEADTALYGSRFKAGDGEFKVEFLTPLKGRDTGKRTEIRQLGIPAIPLRFLDYLIVEPVLAIALGRKPVLVRVPSPARYAVHKLIVAQERKASPKSQKDLEQSFDLQRVLLKLDPEGLEEAFDDARQRGSGWVKRVDAGQAALTRLFGDPERSFGG